MILKRYNLYGNYGDNKYGFNNMLREEPDGILVHYDDVKEYIELWQKELHTVKDELSRYQTKVVESTTKKIIIHNPVDNTYIYVDHSSGGYPAFMKNPEEATSFFSVEKALDYRKTFIGSYNKPSFDSDSWRVLVVQFSLNILEEH